MIFVFGTILQAIRITTDPGAKTGTIEYARHYKNSVTGKGALQAVAAAQAGAKTALAGKTGDDELAKHILLRLRTHGVITSAVAKAEKLQTGTAIQILDENRTILALGASAKTSSEQLPVEIFDKKSIVLMQTELGMKENSKLLEKAKKGGATTLLNISPPIEIAEENLENLDILIAPFAHKKRLHKALGKKHLTIIFLKPDGSCELIVNGGAPAAIARPEIEEVEWKYPDGSEDVFCANLAAGLSTGLPLQKNILRAQVAASLTASKPGAYESIPYSHAVDEIMKQITNDGQTG